MTWIRFADVDRGRDRQPESLPSSEPLFYVCDAILPFETRPKFGTTSSHVSRTNRLSAKEASSSLVVRVVDRLHAYST